VAEARLEAQLLLVHASGLTRADVLAHPEQPLPTFAYTTFLDLLRRRRARVPLAYLTGWREFYGRTFAVSPAVLIPRPESEYLADLALAELLAHPDQPLTRPTQATFLDLVRRRRARVPLAYLTGWREFYGRPFAVTPAVLIPRPESENLVDLVLAELRRRADGARVLDLGTGSGTLAVTIALEAPASRVFASDVSGEALAVAAQNARRLGARVGFFRADLLEAVREPMDLTVANLPYVSCAELAEAAPEVRAHEPALALVGGERGTELLERLLPQLGDRLRPGGVALLEIGWLQGAAMRRLARAALPEAEIDVLKDFAGLDRVLRVRRA
jgi:release factor glutamine methyltransferase